jgi:vacuolar-type H+-ATPase subunit I/STV1
VSTPTESTASNQSSGSLNTAISIAVALAGTFMALCSVKEGNINQAMADTQAKTVNGWAYFQSKSTKQNLAEATMEQLKVMKTLSASAVPEAISEMESKVAAYATKITRYEEEKEKIKQDTQALEKKYEELDRQGDQFDIADAAMSVGIALCGMAALVERRSLCAVAFVFLVAGMGIGVAGFLNIPFEVPFLAKLLN